MTDELITYFETFITERRKKLFDTIINFRTRFITVVLEDIFQAHNASAVLRSCDCFGIQDVHILENRNEYDVNPDIALGADKWLNLIKHKYSKAKLHITINSLRERGYRIVATTPHEPNTELEQFNLNLGPVALLFGTELEGLTDNIKKEADEFLKIPMYGFTESLNISVSAAIILQFLTTRLHQSNINWQLNEDEKKEIKLGWLRKSIKNSKTIERAFLAKNINNQKFRI
jgi:tRNA (guanosine-2'-O-)-methyltransferase